MKTFIDRKRAASGEREDEAEMPLASPQSLVAALHGTRTEQRSSEPEKRPVEAVAKLLTFDIGVEQIERALENHLSNAFKPLFEYDEDYRIHVEFSKGTSGSVHQLMIGKVGRNQLCKDGPSGDRYQGNRIAEKLHALLYKVRINRNDLVTATGQPFRGMVLEASFFSESKNHRLFLGHAKLFFPHPHDELVFYFHLFPM
jgi:hypothetical protein